MVTNNNSLFIQKGTGKWTAISALEYGMPVTLIGNNKLFQILFIQCFTYFKEVFSLCVL